MSVIEVQFKPPGLKFLKTKDEHFCENDASFQLFNN